MWEELAKVCGGQGRGTGGRGEDCEVVETGRQQGEGQGVEPEIKVISLRVSRVKAAKTYFRMSNTRSRGRATPTSHPATPTMVKRVCERMNSLVS